MKKLLFWLLLTVGVSGFSFGNTIIEIEDFKENSIDKTLFADCIFSFVTRSYNCDGSFNTITNPSFTGPCPSGTSGGTIIRTVSTVDGCPQGPGTGIG